MTSRHLKPEDWLRLGQRYEAGETSADLAREASVESSTFHWKMRKLGVAMRPKGHKLKRVDGVPVYRCNDHYFDTIDTEEKAYYLGLLASDGCVHSTRARFDIGLSGDEDRVLIERFVASIEFTGPIREKKVKYSGAKKHHRVTINSKRNVENLIRLGVTPRKSLTLRFPTPDQVPPHLIRHYVRGCFDGDGSVSFKKSGDFLTSIISSRGFIESLHTFLTETLGLSSHIEYFKAPKNPQSAVLKVGGNLASFILLNWMYEDATIALPRKQAKYEMCKGVVAAKLSKTENLFNVRSHPVTMKNAAQCAKILGINLRLDEWNGLSLSKEEQAEIIALYSQGHAIKHIRKMRNCSNTLIRNVLTRNGVAIRGVTAQSIAQKQLAA